MGCCGSACEGVLMNEWNSLVACQETSAKFCRQTTVY